MKRVLDRWRGRISGRLAWVFALLTCLCIVCVRQTPVSAPATRPAVSVIQPEVVDGMALQGKIHLLMHRMFSGTPSPATVEKHRREIEQNMPASFTRDVCLAILDHETQRPGFDIHLALAQMRDHQFSVERLRLIDLIDRCAQGAAIDGEDASFLGDRLGWFSELAETWALPDGDPERKAVRNTWPLVLFCAGVCVGAFLLFVASIAAVVTVIVWAARKKIHFRRPASLAMQGARPLWIFTAAMGMLLLLAIVERFEHRLPAAWATSFSVAMAFLMPASLLLLLLRPQGSRRHVLSALGWRVRTGVVKEAMMGLVGYLACLPLAFVAAIVTAILIQITGEDPHPSRISEMGHVSPWSLALLGAMLTLWAPVTEETLFRGLLLSRLRAWPMLLSAGITATLFAVIHPQSWVAFPVLMALGFSFAMIRFWRGNIVSSMAAHAFHNGMIFLVLLFAIPVLGFGSGLVAMLRAVVGV